MERTIRQGACLLAAVALMVLAAGARADSIWARAQGKEGQKHVRVYEDDTARDVGDTLTPLPAASTSATWGSGTATGAAPS